MVRGGDAGEVKIQTVTLPVWPALPSPPCGVLIGIGSVLPGRLTVPQMLSSFMGQLVQEESGRNRSMLCSLYQPLQQYS